MEIHYYSVKVRDSERKHKKTRHYPVITVNGRTFVWLDHSLDQDHKAWKRARKYKHRIERACSAVPWDKEMWLRVLMHGPWHEVRIFGEPVKTPEAESFIVLAPRPTS